MPKFPNVAPVIARASLARRRGPAENHLALQLPRPEYCDPRVDTPGLIEGEDDAAALVLDRDGNFTWVRL